MACSCIVQMLKDGCKDCPFKTGIPAELGDKEYEALLRFWTEKQREIKERAEGFVEVK